jgi:hypothetical protein
MLTTGDEQRALSAAAGTLLGIDSTFEPPLETPLCALENQLATLSLALRGQDAKAIEAAAAALHTALVTALAQFTHAARNGGVPSALRQRLAVAGGHVAAQREALARATASLDRAIDVLLPPPAQPALYGASGAAARTHRLGGSLLA